MKHEEQGHFCKFQKRSQTLDALYPPGLRFSKLRRKFRELFLISEENGRKCFTPLGSAGYIFEKEKQLIHHPLMIHPHSKFCEYWEWFRILEIFLSLLIRPFIVSQFTWKAFMRLDYQVIGLCDDLFQMMDVALRFGIGYIDHGIVVLELQKVFFHNLTRFSFYLNVIASFPFEFVVYLFAVVNGPPHPIFLFAVFLKVFQLFPFTRYLSHMCKIYNWSEFHWRFVWTIFNMILSYQWLTCFYYLAVFSKEFCENEKYAFIHKTEFFFRYMVTMYFICNTFFYGISFFSNIHFDNLKDQLVSSFVFVMANFSAMVYVGQFVHLLGLLKTSRIQYEELIQEVRKFLSQENLPKQVHLKVEKYFQFRFRNTYFREKRILDTVSPPLKKEIITFLCLNLLLNEESIFHGIPIDLAESLCQQMTFEVFLPGDEIVRAGKRGKKMYFLYSGSVAVYSPSGRELLHLHEGKQFGVTAFLSNNTYLGTVIALEMTECYCLLQPDFAKFAAAYPDYGDVVYNAANKKRKFLKEFESGERKFTLD